MKVLVGHHDANLAVAEYVERLFPGMRATHAKPIFRHTGVVDSRGYEVTVDFEIDIEPDGLSESN